MTITPTTVDELLDWWPGNIPFKGELISEDGCMCAQGQVLHLLGGYSADDLRQIEQADADRKTAAIMGISGAHAILLRQVNDKQPGAPTCVIRDPEKVLGGEVQKVLAFWRHLDRMSGEDWRNVAKARVAARDAARSAARSAARDAARSAARNAARSAARNAARDAAWNAARDAAWVAARDAAGDAAWAAAGAAAGVAAGAAAGVAAGAAARATSEIQGAAIMRERGQPFFFLPMFGFADPEAVLAALCEKGESA
jgi:pyruvate/2-oxoglutarate dehydrogenase complex dihydrolipoamide acyltransferase (E2) component